MGEKKGSGIMPYRAELLYAGVRKRRKGMEGKPDPFGAFCVFPGGNQTIGG